MAYSNFTLETVRKTFQLEADEAADISSGIEPVPPSEYLILNNFEDELEEVDEPIFELSAQLLVALAPGELETLNALVQSRGISPESLIREWILEHIEVR